MNNEVKKRSQDDPEVLNIDEPLESDPIVEEIVIQCCEEPDLEDIVLIDLTEIEKTKQDLSVRDITKKEEIKEKINCFVCNSIMEGGVYLCPVCATFYCRKCIKSVIDRGGICLNCKHRV